MQKKITPRDKIFIWKIIKQSMPLLLVVAVVEAATGSVLGSLVDALILIPGLLILVPPIMDLRGNIGTALGSRLSSALHLSMIKPEFKRTKILTSNLIGDLINTTAMAIFIGIFAHYASVFLGLPTAGLAVLIPIALIAALISIFILEPVSIAIVFYAFKKKVEPDNILAPALSIIGDFIAVSVLMLSASFVVNIQINPIVMVPFLFMAVSKLNGLSEKKLKMRKKLRQHYRVRRIVFESLPILIFAVFLSGIAGLFLHYYLESFDKLPGLLIMVPQMIAMGGGIGGILGARLSSALDEGYIKPYHFGKRFRDNWISIVIMGYIKAIVIGILAFGAAELLGLANPGLVSMMSIALIAGTVIIIVVLILDTVVSCESFKRGIDPSNTTIPIITSATDMLGTLALLGAAILLGII
jgi:mgtE-like transporter